MQLFSAPDYIKIDIANNFGYAEQFGKKLDKCDWNQRIEWFDQHEGQLDSLVAKAEEKPLFFAGVQAWNDFKTGTPSGYAPSLDGCSSGLQILSAISGDRAGASLCGVINTGHREDAYSSVFDHMQENCSIELRTSAKAVKQAVMTLKVGSLSK